MHNQELKQRTKEFALRTIRLVNALPKSPAGDVIGRQLLRAATSVAANYRSSCRARSKPDFVAKMGIVEEEADESGLWLELIAEAGLLQARKTSALLDEANQLTGIAVASIRTARSRLRHPQSAVRSPKSP